jgi:hypothetical protein
LISSLSQASTRLARASAFLRRRRVRRTLNVVFVIGAGAVTAASVHHFLTAGWPMHGANPWLVAVAAGIFLVAYGLKAQGWRRLFALHERPSTHALAAAGGAAACTGLALPGRFDDVVRIAVLRRFRGPKAGLGALCLSLVLVALIDSAAITPLASVAAGLTHASGRFSRFRLVRWLRQHSTCPLEATKAWLLVSLSWSLRALALYVLLAALGVGWSFGLALLFLCATAASTALPIAPAGAATQAGAGAAILAVAGVGTSHAIAFAISAQALVILAGATVVLLAAAWEARLRFRPSLSAA